MGHLCLCHSGSFESDYVQKIEIIKKAAVFFFPYKVWHMLEGGLMASFGTDARSITRTLENIKDPEQVEKAVLTENVEKFVERNKQLKK